MSIWSDILWPVVGGLVRAAAAALSGYLIAHHVLTQTQGESFIVAVVNHTAIAAPLILAAAWSVLNKYLHQTKLGTAIDAMKTAVAAQQKGVGV